MNEFYAQKVGICAPGLDNWQNAASILTGRETHSIREIATHPPPRLPANERRRLPFMGKLALSAAMEAVADTADTQNLATVFVSSDGDMAILDQICYALTLKDRPVSPIAFHNSVHNAPAGYWHIATQSPAPSTSLSAFDDSFIAGILESASQLLAGQPRVLLVVYDMASPSRIIPVRPITSSFAAAFLLETASLNALGKFRFYFSREGEEDRMSDSSLEQLRLGNPAARCLPWLQALARNQNRLIHLPYRENQYFAMEALPC